jgi:SAM-dependent MidA family methyltransferase
MNDLPAFLRGVLIANELIDNLPMSLAQKTTNGWCERWVGHGDNGFDFVDVPARDEIVEWLERFAGPVALGGLVEVQLEAARWLRALLLQWKGTIVLIDYGELAENLAHRRTEGTLRTYQRHHLGPPILHDPGTTDITADVNFSALLTISSEAGWTVDLQRQDDFLNEWGLAERLADLRSQELAWSGKDENRRLRLRHEIVNGKTLLNERGLGDFRVLIARSP